MKDVKVIHDWKMDSLHNERRRIVVDDQGFLRLQKTNDTCNGKWYSAREEFDYKIHEIAWLAKELAERREDNGTT